MKQASINFKSKKKVFNEASNIKDSLTAQNSKVIVINDATSVIESPTPEKPESRSKNRGVGDSRLKGKQLLDDFKVESEKLGYENVGDDSVELPDEYKTLQTLFERMDSSIRLLALRKKLSTFRNISNQVEILLKRKLLCSHLAQMKHVFPEAIQIESILVHDQKTSCMIPEMKVSLVKDFVKIDPDQSASFALCKVFRARLVHFFKTHPEGTNIPHAILPEPFNGGNQIVPETIQKTSSEEHPQEPSTEPVLSVSHFSSSFKEHFIHKILPETQNIDPPPAVDDRVEVLKSPLNKPAKQSYRIVRQNPENTPAKDSSTADALMIRTPSLRTPKRAVPTTDKKIDAENERLADGPKSASGARRSLIYSPSEAEGCASDPAGYKNRNVFGVDVIGSLAKNVHKAFELAAYVNKDHKISQAAASLLCMFDTICLIWRSTDCSLITKQELIHKIILNNLEIEETGEVEEQLQLLEELVPDWISKKSASDGNCFYSVEKVYDRETIRAKLVEAV